MDAALIQELSDRFPPAIVTFRKSSGIILSINREITRKTGQKNKDIQDGIRIVDGETILFGGVLIDLLLLLVFLVLSRSNQRAIDFADRMTVELQARTSELENSNRELEKPANVTSHDLERSGTPSKILLRPKGGAR